MDKRPTSITIISWFLIGSALITLIQIFLMYDKPEYKEMLKLSKIPAVWQYLITFVGLAIMAISGTAMLKGKNWGRFLYVIWTAIGFIVTFFSMQFTTILIPGLIFYAIVVFFLFRPIANNFFIQNQLTSNSLEK